MNFPEGFLRNESDPVLLSKRWSGIVPGNGENLSNIVPGGPNRNGGQWPQGRIRACIDPSMPVETQLDIKNSLELGMDQWYSAGLSPMSFSLRVLTENECRAAGVTGRKKDYLWVVRQDDALLAADMGNLAAGSTLYAQPFAYFEPGTEGLSVIQGYKRVRAYAHELGQ
jgi:hypothetical protein